MRENIHRNESDFTHVQGYLNNPTATKESITTDGWYKTGDVCTRDAEGFYTVVDRIKELIKYKVYLPHSLFGFLNANLFR